VLILEEKPSYVKPKQASVLNFTSPFRRAGAVKAMPTAGAGTTVGAGITGAVVDGAVGRNAHKAGIADALRSMGVLHANTIGRASRVLAEAPQFAVASRVARWTLAVI